MLTLRPQHTPPRRQEWVTKEPREARWAEQMLWTNVSSSLGDRILGDFYFSLYSSALCIRHTTHIPFLISFFCKTPYYVVWKPDVPILCEWGLVISNNLSYWQHFNACRLGNFSSQDSTHISRILLFRDHGFTSLKEIMLCEFWAYLPGLKGSVCSLWQLYIEKLLRAKKEMWKKK